MWCMSMSMCMFTCLLSRGHVHHVQVPAALSLDAFESALREASFYRKANRAATEPRPAAHAGASPDLRRPRASASPPSTSPMRALARLDAADEHAVWTMGARPAAG